MEAGIPLEQEEKKGGSKSPLLIILSALIIFETIRVVYLSRKKKETIGKTLKGELKLLSSPTAVVAIMGFVTGVMEFVIASNIKEHGFPDSLKGGKLFKLPSKQELIQTATIILIVSTITGLLTDITLKKIAGVKEEDLSSKLMN